MSIIWAPPHNWSKSKIDANIFDQYGKTITQFTEFDKESIMIYPIDNELTIGDFEVGWNTVPSDTDKFFVRYVYPPSIRTFARQNGIHPQFSTKANLIPILENKTNTDSLRHLIATNC